AGRLREVLDQIGARIEVRRIERDRLLEGRLATMRELVLQEEVGLERVPGVGLAEPVPVDGVVVIERDRALEPVDRRTKMPLVERRASQIERGDGVRLGVRLEQRHGRRAMARVEEREPRDERRVGRDLAVDSRREERAQYERNRAVTHVK